MEIVWLLVLLNISHWVCDFLIRTPNMIASKKFGKPLFPIYLHSMTHACAAAIIILIPFYNRPDSLPEVCVVIILVSHFIIDVFKGRLNILFPSLANAAKSGFWTMFGFDQLLHQFIIILVSYSLTK